MVAAMKILLISILLTGIALTADGQEKDFDFWKVAVAHQSLPDIANLLNQETNSWPKASSSFAIRSLTGREQEKASEAIALVKALHMRIRDEVKATSNGAYDTVKLEAYVKIAHKLEESGGYSNILLADTVRRIVLFQESQAAVTRARPLADIQKSLDNLSVPTVDAKMLLEKFAADDEFLSTKQEAISKIMTGQSLFESLAIAGMPENEILAPRTFTELFENPSAGALVLRLAQTEMLYVVSMKGMLAFLERGGTFEELNPADIRPFKARMAGAEKSFKYPLLGVRYLRGSDVDTLIELHQNIAVRESFLRGILE